MTNERMSAAVLVVPLIAQRGDETDVGNILLYILIGLVVGLLARFLVPGRDPFGFLGTLVIGVLGAVIGGWLAGNVFEETEGVDWIASILVAVVLVLLAKNLPRRRRVF